MKKQKLSPRKLLFFEEKSYAQELEFGTGQNALMGSGDLAGPESKLTAGGQQGYEGK